MAALTRNQIVVRNAIPFFSKNLCPISRLNNDYKIATRCIASRLKHVLQSVIHSDQTGYLKGRYIGENVRLLFDIIEHITEYESQGYFSSLTSKMLLIALIIVLLRKHFASLSLVMIVSAGLMSFIKTFHVARYNK